MSRWLATALLALAVAATAGIASTQAASTTASTVVTAEVLSATNLDVATACASGTSDITNFGQLLPNTSNVTGTDCSVQFGSSNDTSMLRLYQSTGGGSAMVAGPTTTTLGYWPMNGDFRDVSATGNTGDPLPAGPNDPSYAAGPTSRGDYMNFDGDDIATIPHHASYNVTTFTVDLWFRTSDVNAVIAAREDVDCGSGPHCQWEFYMGAGRMYAEIDIGGSWYGPISTAPINDGAWHHAAMVVNDATKTVDLYIDGQWDADDSTSSDWLAGSIPAGTSGIIMGESAWGFNKYVGDLDELRFQAGARTANDIRSYYLANVADYNDTVDDWNTASPNDSVFGACLSSVAGAGVNATWTVNAACTATDGAYWQPIGDTAAAGNAKIAESTTSGTTTAQAGLRFGFRTASDQPAGTYSAPITFEAVAPNV